MNDFFTELDSDILGTKSHAHAPNRYPDKRMKHAHTKTERMPVSRVQQPRVQEVGNQKKPNDTPNNHVVEMRTQMMSAGVVVLVFKVDEKTRALLGHIRIETRGFAFADEVRELHKIIIKKSRASYEDTVKDIPDIEEKDLIKIIRRDLEIFLQDRIERIPVIIPMILCV
ncbi:MAG: hypothetical protein PHH70_00990 [Candidatus Gracilibacteria bacterium]|nr:hypothetical protein [Candidatus Gracilibacteria bacterium]